MGTFAPEEEGQFPVVYRLGTKGHVVILGSEGCVDFPRLFCLRDWDQIQTARCGIYKR